MAPFLDEPTKSIRSSGKRVFVTSMQQHERMQILEQQIQSLSNELSTRAIRLRPQSPPKIACQCDVNSQRAHAPKGSQKRPPQRKVDLVPPLLRHFALVETEREVFNEQQCARNPVADLRHRGHLEVELRARHTQGDVRRVCGL